ncbi:hypothetical protein DSM106972_098130 [Dulcicalothrix desertica PCC 7102]|jgi:hypothetical protein|uniref:Uncharacterized protein n=1 Tax=Dulcicalothrix desertica PCC 7102 TaxID=232991 RepID=A0A3S1A2Y7_9CYAN|nr:hypothetical protein [Dulcicalothrix desertica]RUS92794.1 hypothetical protein DSM106972_098130 [Dulcicalothrix desertica PCC 7102]TWH61450.1 hypothetical protein CAL7102_01017 [Dulcicalothrix desertica PCC 7102]BDA76488.1 hypothetical protein CAL7716_106540 [Calothrix sp. PCC 7716]
MSNYSSRRITISYFAAIEACRIAGLPLDIPPQALAGAVEKLIFQFESDKQPSSQPKAEPPKTQMVEANKNALAAMVKGYAAK